MSEASFAKQTQSQTRSKKKAIDRNQAAVPSNEAAAAQISDQPKTSEDRRLILSAFSKHIIFTALDEESKEAAVASMKYLAFSPGKLVMEEGHRATYYFVMISGEAEKLAGGERTGLLHPGESFGEVALMHNELRHISVRTLTCCTFWALDRFSFRHFVDIINLSAQRDNEAFVSCSPMLKGLTEFQREALVSALTVCSYPKGAVIIHEDTLGDWVYFLKEGEVVCTKQNSVLRTMGPGEFFGELAFLSEGRRTATVTAVTDVKCAYISAQHFVSTLDHTVQNIIYINMIRIALEQSGIAARLLQWQLGKLVKSMRIECFDNGSVVLSKDTHLSTGLWIVLKGTLMCGDAEFASAFGCFGLQTSDTTKDNITVASDFANVAWLTREEVEALIQCAWAATPESMEAFAVLKKVPFFKCLSEEQVMHLALSTKLQHFSDKEIIPTNECFYVLKAGEVTCPENSSEDVTCFGEYSLFGRASPAVTARGNVTCWVLARSDFIRIITAPMRELLRRRLELYDTSVDLQDLVPVKLLGKGMFGLVFLVFSKQRKCLYALKSVSRSKISRYGLHRNVVLERDIMLQLDHPLLVKLVKTYKDQKRIYFLTEYVSGIEFFEVLRVLGLVRDSDAKFYIASLLLVLEHLHARSIAYRDLKPENIMVDEEGYVKLIDFGTAKVVSGRTFSVVGTPHYMAPEVILGKGYGLMVDLWSLGIILYEMECGSVPFGEEDDDPYAVYEHTLDHQLSFPKLLETRCEVRQVIEQLLSPNPSQRSDGGALHLKSHKWLKGFDWEALACRTHPPPYQPKNDYSFMEVQRVKDVQATVDLEEAEELPPPSEQSAPPPEWDEEF